MLPAAAKGFSKDLRFTGYEPDFRIPESFPGERFRPPAKMPSSHCGREPPPEVHALRP